jgi:hypothetical protein
MVNQEICFVPGCGGHWLRALVKSLEANKFLIRQIGNTFHDPTRARQFYMTHNRQSPTALSFNGSAYFNIFLNFMYKNKVNEPNVGNYIDIAACSAVDIMSYKSMKTDLDFNLIFIDQEGFINNLFNLLDSSNIVYTKNKDICRRAIAEYKKTCTDPVMHFDNYNSLEWLGWCLGVMKIETGQLPYVESIEKAVELLASNKEYYKNYTLDKMVKLNG